MASDHANHAAVLAAGYAATETNRGTSFPAAERFHCHYDKPIVGVPGQSGQIIEADGYGVDAATARAQALIALNIQRGARYGKGATNNVGHAGGAVLVTDVN